MELGESANAQAPSIPPSAMSFAGCYELKLGRWWPWSFGEDNQFVTPASKIQLLPQQGTEGFEKNGLVDSSNSSGQWECIWWPPQVFLLASKVRQSCPTYLDERLFWSLPQPWKARGQTARLGTSALRLPHIHPAHHARDGATNFLSLTEFQGSVYLVLVQPLLSNAASFNFGIRFV